MQLFPLILLLAVSLFSQSPNVGPESGMPNLAQSPDGSVYLSWIDTLGAEGHALRYAKWSDGKWGEPETIAKGKGWFVNWADFPALTVLTDGSMFAHWLTRYPEGGKYGYGIRIASKASGANEWKQTHSMRLEEKDDYAGFLTFIPNAGGAIYLVPPLAPEDGHRKTVRFVSFSKDGSMAKDIELDADACSCCQTAVGRTSRGLIAAYRDHQPGEIRNIAIVRERDGVWSKPETLHADGWKINGCPTDGPSIATSGSDAAVMWLTRATDQPKVKAVLSRDGGLTFGSPIPMDDGNPAGRPSITMLDTKSFLGVWLEKTSDKTVEIRARRIGLDGKRGASKRIAEASFGRAVGVPRVVVSGDKVLVAWRDVGVKLAWIETKDFSDQTGATRPPR